MFHRKITKFESRELRAVSCISCQSSLSFLAGPDTLEKKLDTMLKHPELKILVNKYFYLDDASEVMSMANYLASQGNGVFLDKFLEALRDIDRADRKGIVYCF